MRIIVTSIVDPLMAAHNRIHHLVSSISEGNDVHVVCTKETWKTKTGDIAAYARTGRSFMKGVDVRYLHNSWKPIWQECSSVWRLRRILEEIGDLSYDVHLDYNSFLLGNSTNLLTNTRLTVYDLADDLVDMVRLSPQIPSAISPAVSLVARRLVKRMIRKADVVTCISRGLLTRYGVPESKGIVIPNGVDTRVFVPSNGEPVREMLAIPNDAFVVGYVGVLREWIDMGMILRAIRMLSRKGNEVWLLVVGEEGGLKQIRTDAEKLGIRDRITMTGTVAYDQVPNMIGAMDVGVIPFKSCLVSEGAVPLKLFEYMSCGIPVVTTYSEGIYESVGEAVLYAGNEYEVCNQISRMMKSRAEYEKYSIAGRQLVLERHSWERTEAKMRSLIETHGLGSTEYRRGF